MYQLATLSEDIVDHVEPFLPPGKPTAPGGGPFIPKGNSYGKNLDAYPLTDNLKITIWECMYENKEHRISIADLKRRAVQVIAAFEANGGTEDAYADLIPSEPPNNVATAAGPSVTVPLAAALPDPEEVLVTCYCVAKLRRGNRAGRKCGRKAKPLTKADIKAGLARCLHHPIGAWPEIGK